MNQTNTTERRGGIAVTDITGFIGHPLTARLLARGDARVFGLGTLRPRALPPEVGFFTLNLAATGASAKLAKWLAREHITTLVHLAPRTTPSCWSDEPTTNPADGSDAATSFVDETAQLFRACALAGVTRVVLASSTQCYGAHPDNPNFLDERAPLRGSAQNGAVQRLLAAERLAADFARAHPGAALTVLRCCWTLGARAQDPSARALTHPRLARLPRVAGLARLARAARGVTPTLLGHDPLLQLLHEDDCVAAFEQAARAPHPGVFNIVGPGVAPLSVLLRSAGRRALPLPAPLWSSIGALPAAAEDDLRYLWVADGARGWAEFGHPRYSTREAWAAFIAATRLQRLRV